MSRWEWLAAVEGFGMANGWKLDKPVKAMSAQRMRELGIEV